MSIKPKFNDEKFSEMGKHLGIFDSLAKALWEYCGHTYGNDAFDKLWQALTTATGKAPHEYKTEDEFLSHALCRAVKRLGGRELLDDVKELVRLRFKGQFSSSMYRRSYRSRDFGYYSARMLRRLADWIKFSCYDMGVRDMLTADHSGVPGFSDMLALAINRGDKVCIDTVREMILGDNNVLLSRDVIIAVIRSDNEGLKEDLARLLVAAGRQEGLRQAILESADEGDKKTFRLFLKTCMDNDMFRFTAAARALYSWTGLYREEIDIAETRKLAQTAWDCLTNLQKRKECFESENPLDMYLAMWAVGCGDVAETDRLAERLITDEKTYKRLLGWFFVMHVENDTYRHTMAASHLDERDPKVLSLLLPCLHHNYKAVYATTYNRKDYSAECLPDSMLPKTKEGRRALFEKLKAVVQFIGKENYTFDPVLFPWMATVLNNKDGKPLKCMMSLAAVDLDSRMIDELWELSQYMDSDQRRALYILFLSPDKEPKHRRYIYDGLKDKSASNKEIAIEKLKGCKACEEDVRQICQVLKSKSAAVKKAAVSYLSELDVGLKRFAVKTLAAGGEDEIQAAAELVLGDSKLEKEAPQLLAGLAEKTVSTQTEVLLRQLPGGDKGNDLCLENGYGLFDKNVIGKTLADIGKKPALDRFLSAQEIDALSIKKDEILRLFEELNAVFERHKDHEYQFCAYDGGTQTAVFGDVPQYSGRIHVPKEHGNEWELRRSGKLRLEMMPFANEFKKVLAPWTSDGERLCMLAWVCINSNIGFSGGDTQGWFAPLTGRFGRRASEDLWERFKGRTAQMTELIELSLKEADQSEVFDTAYSVYFSLCRIIGEKNLARDYAVNKWSGYNTNSPALGCSFMARLRSIISGLKLSDGEFALWAAQEYRLERSLEFKAGSYFSTQDMLRAVDIKALPLDCLFERALTEAGGRYYAADISLLTDPKLAARNGLVTKYPWFEEKMKLLSDHVTRFEAKRGQAETPLSSRALKIGRCEGAELFCMLLAALGKENFYRGYVWGGDRTKNCVLSSLLKKCWPSEGDSAQSLKALLDKTDISEKRLIEAAMYAPQWAGFVEEITGWKGLRKAVWFFQAHISEHFSAEKETEVALYSPITPQQFNDGAFDIDWFRESYGALGEKRFKLLYNSAKYITSGSNAHRRSQLYTDAVLGRFDIKEFEQEIKEKRNQEKLRAYGLIPVEKSDEKELLRRYEFIQTFVKESRQFGALRRDSEKKAASVALENLAISCGVFDVDRMLWRLESAKNEEIRPLTQKKNVQGYDLYLVFDEDGDCSVRTEKDGKAMKSLPKALAKDEYAELLKQTAKELKDQKKRCRATLEKAMTDRSSFDAEELSGIFSSPVISPMVRRLVFKDSSGHLGFIKQDEGGRLMLTALDGEVFSVSGSLTIAHAYDLKESGCWAEFMHYAYENKLVQPFRQVFRELYPVTDEERREGVRSRRYAGYQVQPRQVVALLKSRGWTVDYEEGLQKVWYSQSVVARLYAQADWFSPADIEAPVLEYVEFSERGKDELINLCDIDPVLFSEIMRDLDLAVSVAYVGGVDAETSHSTVEMRTAIAKELCSMLRLENVSFGDRHAFIKGKLSEYTVHMGSGVVHAKEKGMVPILAVQSQHRGRVFLPFADEDPKTAEIMSKIILLSEDQKIKDPEILKMLY